MEVGNDTIAQRPDHPYVLMGPAMHLPGPVAYGNKLARIPVDGHYRWLIHHKLVIGNYICIGCTQVYSNLL